MNILKETLNQIGDNASANYIKDHNMNEQNSKLAKLEVKEYDIDMEYINKVVLKALEWAFDAWRGPLWVSAAGGTWNVLAGNLARFLNIDYPSAQSLLRKAASEKYGNDYYGILWIRVGITDRSFPYRDARGVKTYLERLQKKGLL